MNLILVYIFYIVYLERVPINWWKACMKVSKMRRFWNSARDVTLRFFILLLKAM